MLIMIETLHQVWPKEIVWPADVEEEGFLKVDRVGDYKKQVPFVFAVCGYKNSGKTTLITATIPELIRRGFRVAVIKHDGHDFEPDVPGTDSFRHRQAGAYGTAVYSANRYMVTKETSGMDERALMEIFPEADIILIEGLKGSHYPKYICDYPNKPMIEPGKLADRIVREMNKTE